MPDIQLRFNKDMLVLSTPIDYQLQAQGFSEPGDREYVALCEPELIEETYKLEKIMETPCLVTATDGITRARLAYARFEKQADEMARIAYELGSSFSPQHLIAAIGPTGLPLDPTMASSVKQSRAQYREAAEILTRYPFDALYLTGFTTLEDVKCALYGVHEARSGETSTESSIPVFISLIVGSDGLLSDGITLEDAVQTCDSLGADVIGVMSGALPSVLVGFARTMRTVTKKPLLFDILVNRIDSRQFEPTEENAYPTADSIFAAACALQQVGVQFLRASGNATPSYTGALNAAVLGNDVKVAE